MLQMASQRAISADGATIMWVEKKQKQKTNKPKTSLQIPRSQRFSSKEISQWQIMLTEGEQGSQVYSQQSSEGFLHAASYQVHQTCWNFLA